MFNRKRLSSPTLWLVLVLIAASPAILEASNPLDQRFVYSGRLDSPANLHFGNGICDLSFQLFDAPSAGLQIGAAEVIEDVPVIDFHYHVELNTSAAFGPDAFTGDERFMAVSTRCSPGSDPPGSPPPSGPFVDQPDRERLVTVPFALWAQDAGVDLSGLWNIFGNSGTNPVDHFVGTTDAQPLGFRTEGKERMRIGIDGKVGIGTTGPASQLHLRETASADAEARFEGSQPRLTLQRGTTGLSELGYVIDEDDLRLINFEGGASLVLAADGSVCLGSGC